MALKPFSSQKLSTRRFNPLNATPTPLNEPYFPYTTLLLSGNGTDGAQNNTFLDGSTNNFTITRNGNTTQGTFSPFSQTGWGNYFDGSGDYLTLASNAALAFGTGDFTFEFWLNISAHTTSDGRPLGNNTSWAANAWSLHSDHASYNEKISFWVNNYSSSAVMLVSTTTIAIGTWYHVAVTRNGNSWRLFINGTQEGSTVTSSVGIDGGSSDDLFVGGSGAANEYINGYISNLRITKGGALYTSNFTPSTTPLTTTVSAGTVSLLTCQSNRFIDNSSNNFTITRNGDTRVVAFSPFNPSASWSAATYGGSGYFDGSGDYLTIPDDASWDLSSSTGSIELFVYPPVAATGTPGLIGQCPTTANWSIYIYSDGRIAVGIQGVSELATAGGSLIVNSMNHIVITRDSGTSRTRLFVNGILKATGTGTYFNNSSASLHIGYFNGYSFNGYISEVRFCKGSIPTTYQTSSITVGDSIFTPPSAPITTSSQGATSGDVKLLLNFTNAGIYDATSKNDLETVGNAQISTTQSKWGGSSMSFDGTGDYLQAPIDANPYYNFGTGDFTVECWFYANSLSATDFAALLGCNNSGAGNNEWGAYVRSNGIFFYGSSGTLTGVAGTINTGTWYHYAASRSGNTLRIFLNGTQTTSATVTGSYTNSAVGLRVGDDPVGSNPAFNGYLQDVRITKGYARYTSSFTPPTAAFPTL